jgi:hypothetical protein
MHNARFLSCGNDHSNPVSLSLVFVVDASRSEGSQGSVVEGRSCER